MTQEQQPEPTQPDGNQTGVGAVDKLQAMAGPEDSGAVEAPEAGDESLESPEDDFIEVEVADGVTERLSRQELQKLVVSRKEAEETLRVARRELDKSQGAKALLQRLDGLPKEAREFFFQALEKPDLLNAARRPAGREHNPFEDEEYGTMSNQHANDPRYEKLESELQEMKSLLQREQARQAEQDAVSQIEQGMSGINVFRVLREQSPEVYGWARDAIINELKLNPEADPRTVMHKHATMVHRNAVGAKRSPQPTPRDPRGQSSEARQFTGAQLDGGDVLSSALEFVRQRRQQQG